MFELSCEHCGETGICGYYERYCRAGFTKCLGTSCSRYTPLGTTIKLLEKAKEDHWKKMLGVIKIKGE